MAEPEYPSVWVLFSNLIRSKQQPQEMFAGSYSAERALQETALPMPSVVECIPRPTHERLIAEAVAAERERCAAIAEFWRYELSEEGCDDWVLATRIAEKIREVPS